MRQIVYVSLSSVPGDGADLSGILEQSRHNNAIDGITGLLWSDGKSFLQAIEGPRVSVEACFERVKRDPRHYCLTVLSDQRITSHEFGSWNMVHRRANEEANVYDAQVRRLLHQASDGVRAHFMALIGTTRQAQRLPVNTALAKPSMMLTQHTSISTTTPAMGQ
ncbi:MAG: BLUF domain-containing protein [Oxalobacteraceae bacterium]|nr:MAG: BLUF domain-containing protein [Oxalobacteraceae bacterium]